MATAPSSDTAYMQAEPSKPHRVRRILHGIGRGLKWFGIGLVVLVLLGSGAEPTGGTYTSLRL
jgi:hypothetical protein